MLKYTAHRRFPIKRGDGKIEAEMFSLPTLSMARMPLSVL